MKTETPKMDWQQVVLNGGPPCFAQLEDEDGYYCGRAQRWEGHDGEHKFVSLDDLLNAERDRAAKIAETRAERYRTKSHAQKRRGDDSLSEHFLSKCNAALEIAAAIRGE